MHDTEDFSPLFNIYIADRKKSFKKIYRQTKYFIPHILIISILSILCYPFVFAQSWQKVIPGAKQLAAYIKLLRQKRIGIVANQTSMIGNTHLIDKLKESKINIIRIFCPEHGFRGKIEDRKPVKSSFDKKTGLPIISLYGKNIKPKKKHLKDIDLIVFDIQDVGVRYYTYIATLHFVIEACAKHKVELLILDRPNPNGFYIDGPVLNSRHRSFTGMHSVPIVYGMTIAEYARMIMGEGWIKKGNQLKLTIVKCKNYSHKTLYRLPVKPSPNLPNMRSVYLYPTLCFFEGTAISIGRGTRFPFQVYGHPSLKGFSFSFIPKSIPGMSSNPRYLGLRCFGKDLRNIKILNKKIKLKWLIEAYKKFLNKKSFFNRYFDKLAGNTALRKQIISGMNEKKIRKSWQKDLRKFKKIRKKYLLYKDFD